ncbi:MAG: DsbC family protein [Syntrophotaleaceae bacterium]
MKSLLFGVLLALVAVSAQAFPKENCGEQTCTDCHSLSRQEAGFLLGEQAEKILNVELSDMPGVWVVEIEKQGQKYPVYIDFTKTHLMRGEMIRLKDGKNLTTLRNAALNRVDVSRIPLEDALIIGRPKAPTRVIVFTDPQCNFCGKLHYEMKKVVQADPDIAFFIKLFPLNIHPDAYMIAKTILCNRSMTMLEDSLAGRPVPPPLCRAEEVDETLRLGRDLGIRSTPTLILPDGRLFAGFKPAEALLELLDSKATLPSVSASKP